MKKKLIEIMSDNNMILSLSEGRRLIQSNALRVDGEVCNDSNQVISLNEKNKKETKISVGKKKEIILDEQGKIKSKNDTLII